MNKRNMVWTFFAIVLSGIIVFLGLTPEQFGHPKELYRVYLDGKSIGLIESKEDLENYIDDEQSHLKEEYKVDKVYAPNNLNIIKEITYDTNISTTEQIYDKIKDISSFTIKGYKIVIEGIDRILEDGTIIEKEEQSIYVLDKTLFENSVNSTIKAFVNEDEFNSFMNDTQDTSSNSPKIVEDVYIENNITVIEGNIPTDEKIYLSQDELSQYLLFGSTAELETYTITDEYKYSEVAENNKISIEEFFIANPEIINKDRMLSPGEVVNIGIPDPQFNVVEETHEVEIQTIKYKTEIKYDNSFQYGYSKVQQAGINGSTKVTRKIKYVNGTIATSVISGEEELSPAVNEIIIRGGNKTPSIGITGVWAWPTKIPYTINSAYGWRWGKLHQGIDIGGSYGSPIYAINNGTVTISDYNNYNGHYIAINHNNGFSSVYAHLATRYVQKGQSVSIGQVIGTMGKSGFATGTHLHFGVAYGPNPLTGKTFNPLALY